MSMPQRDLGPYQVSAVSMGCMNFAHAYGVPPSEDYADRLLLRALDVGYTMLDTAALYGFGLSEKIIGRALQGQRSRYTLVSKGGLAGVQFPDGIKRVIDGSPAAIRRDCENSLKNLQTDVIDLYYLHRWDKQVPIEESVGAMADLVKEGKVRTLGLSEVSATTIRRAHAVHPIVAVQTEYSLWTREPEIAVIDACRDIGAAFVAFSPVARAFLGGGLRDVAALEAKDIRRTMPRFAPENYAANLTLLDGYTALAREAGCTPAQFAIAWTLAKAPHIVALPGTAKIEHLEENAGAANVKLSGVLIARAEALINNRTVSGGRYNVQAQSEVDTEQF